MTRLDTNNTGWVISYGDNHNGPAEPIAIAQTFDEALAYAETAAGTTLVWPGGYKHRWIPEKGQADGEYWGIKETPTVYTRQPIVNPPSPEPRTPQTGDIVHYKTQLGAITAAIVTGINTTGTINLTGWAPTGHATGPHQHVAQGDDYGQWNWRPNQ